MDDFFWRCNAMKYEMMFFQRLDTNRTYNCYGLKTGKEEDIKE